MKKLIASLVFLAGCHGVAPVPEVKKDNKVKGFDTVRNSDTSLDRVLVTHKCRMVPIEDTVYPVRPVSDRWRYSRYKFMTYGSQDRIHWVLVNKGDVIEKYR